MSVEDKIRSLLRLANQRDNANEAKNARAMAQRIADKHGLDLAAIEREAAAAPESELDPSDLIDDLSEEIVDVAINLFAHLMRGTKSARVKSDSVRAARARVQKAQARARAATAQAQKARKRARDRKSRKRDGT